MSVAASEENGPPPPPAPKKEPPKQRPPGPAPSSRTLNQKNENFTCAELIDLALSPSEIGAVNFNILRMLLHNMCEKMGIDKAPAKVNDMQAHQVQNFKDYVQGNLIASPMPGVLRLGNQGPVPPNMQQGAMRPPPPGRAPPPGQGPPPPPQSGQRQQPIQGQEPPQEEAGSPPPTGRKQPRPQGQGQVPQEGPSQPQPAGGSRQQSPGQVPAEGQMGPSQPQSAAGPRQQTSRQAPPQGQAQQAGPSQQPSAGQKQQRPQGSPQGQAGPDGSQPPQSGQRQQQPTSSGQQGSPQAPTPGGQRQQKQQPPPDEPAGPSQTVQQQQQRQQKPPQQQTRGQQQQQPVSPRSDQHGQQQLGHNAVSPRELVDRLNYMEKQLEALYQLPGNPELLEKARADGTSVSDMWQIIQMNNRIAAAEAAIQKMASLIEDIARNMGKLGSETKLMRKESEKLETVTLDNKSKVQDRSEEIKRLGDNMKNMEKELNNVKSAWKTDRENLQQMLGVDLGRVPSFMKPTTTTTKDTKVKHSPKDSDNSSDRGTQTQRDKPTQVQRHGGEDQTSPRPHHHEIVKLNDAMKNVEKELNNIKTAWKNDHENLQQLLGVDLGKVPSFMKPSKVRHSPKEGDISDRGTQTVKDKTTQSPKQYVKKAVKDYIPPEEFANMTPEEIKKNVTPDEIKMMTPAVYKELSPEQKKAVANVRKSIRNLAPSPPPQAREEGQQQQPTQQQQRQPQQKQQKPMQQQQKQQPIKKEPIIVVNEMSVDELVELPPKEIAERMPYEEAVKLPPEVLEKMTDEQKEKVEKVIKRGPTPAQQQKQQPIKKEPIIVVNEMSVDELVELPPKEIAERMPYEEAVKLPPEVLEKMTDEQKEKVEKVIKRGPTPAQKPKPKEPRPAPRKSLGLALMSEAEIRELSAEDIVKKMSVHEAKTLPDSVLEKLNDDQKAAVKKVKVMVIDHPEATPPQKKKKLLRKPTMGLALMTKDQLKEVSAQEIEELMPFEEASEIPQHVVEKLSPEKQEAIKNIVEKGPPKGYKPKPARKSKPNVGLASMSATELKNVSKAQLAEIPYTEAKSIPTEVLEQMTEEQKVVIQEVIEAGPPPPSPEEDEYSEASDDEAFRYDYVDYDQGYEEDGRSAKSEEASQAPVAKSRKDSSTSGRSDVLVIPVLSEGEIENIAEIPAYALAKSITPEMAAAISPKVMQAKFNKEQQKEIEKLKKKLKMKKQKDKAAKKITIEEASQMSPEELAATLTEDNVVDLSDTEIQAMPPEQAKVINEFKKSLGYIIQYSDDSDLLQDQEQELSDYPSGRIETTKSKKQSKAPLRKKTQSHRLKTKGDIHDDRHHHHGHLDVVKGPFPCSDGKKFPPISLDEYLSTLTPEEKAELGTDVLQREMENQYKHLQQMQRQLALDIQEKMEFIYENLLTKIAVQQQSGPQYMTIGEPEPFGPGVCTGQGMPPGTAVCKFPEVAHKRPTSAGTTDGQICPGPGVCPAPVNTTCQCGTAGPASPTQDGRGSMTAGDTDSGGERDRGRKRDTVDVGHDAKASRRSKSPRNSEEHESLLRNMKSLLLLDIEKIREEVKTKHLKFNEKDIMEKVNSLWEALKILKHNEEAMAVKIARQDALIKELPLKLQKLKDENAEGNNSGKTMKTHFQTDEVRRTNPSLNIMADIELPEPLRRSHTGGSASVSPEDIQTLFNNVANVIADCTEMRDKIEQIETTARILETETVSKQMLVEALTDKIDKGMLNTKVSYDDFGSTVDELHNQLHNLMVEGYQRNENWKKVTTEMAAELAEKVDKVELNPLRAFFKSHLKNLDDKVRNLTQLIEEPDPAGTRKKLLRDYNCLSCDRVVNISGVTSGPTLPTIGPIPAGHATASKRALDLHRMRMLRKFDPAKKNVNALEKQGRLNDKTREYLLSAGRKDNDLIHSVNRYQGGSHTEITNADLIASNPNRGSGSRKVTSEPMQSAQGDVKET